MRKVLVVDDEPLVLKSLARMFHGSACVFMTANSPLEALSLLYEQPVDVLVTDHLMTGMTGAQLIRQARRLWPKLEAVVLTATPDEARSELEKSNDQSVTVLDKPWEHQKLYELILPPVLEAA